MALFGRRRAVAGGVGGLDFARLGLPRRETGAADGLSVEGSAVPAGGRGLADRLAPVVRPLDGFLGAGPDGEPLAIVRLHGLIPEWLAKLAAPVRSGHTLIVPRYRSMPTYPVLVFDVVIYPADDDPYTLMLVRDITSGAVQDFVSALHPSGGRVALHVYSSDLRTAPQLLANGDAVLHPSPHPPRWEPYRTTEEELAALRQDLGTGAAWLRQIPEPERDLLTATDAFLIDGH
jgi:hypothetical protein